MYGLLLVKIRKDNTTFIFHTNYLDLKPKGSKETVSPASLIFLWYFSQKKQLFNYILLLDNNNKVTRRRNWYTGHQTITMYSADDGAKLEGVKGWQINYYVENDQYYTGHQTMQVQSTEDKQEYTVWAYEVEELGKSGKFETQAMKGWKVHNEAVEAERQAALARQTATNQDVDSEWTVKVFEGDTERDALTYTRDTEGKGNSISSDNSWNQWDSMKVGSPGNSSGTVAGSLEALTKAGERYIPDTIRNTVKPANIGAGTWNAYIESEAATAASKMGTATKVAKGAGRVAIGVDVGFGIYENIKQGEETKKILLDAAVDTAFGLGGLAASAGAGAAVGSVVPGPGTIIGGFVGGVAYMVGTEVWQPGGKSVKDRTKEEIYNSIK